MKVLMVHNGGLDNDGRVLRSIECLKSVSNVDIVCKGSARGGVHVISGRLYDIPFLGNLLWGFSVFRYIRRKLDCEYVYCHDFLTLSLILLLVYFDKEKKVVYDAHELLLKDSNGASRYAWYWRTMERLVISRVYAVVVANKERSDVMRRFYCLDVDPFVFQNVLEQKVEGKNRMLGSGRVNIVYQGAVSKDRNLCLLFEYLSKSGGDYFLDMVGSGTEVEHLKDLACSLGIDDRIKWHGYVDRSRLYSILDDAHLGVIFYDKFGLNTQLCAPNKIFEYAALGLPVLASDQDSLKVSVLSNEIGVVIGESSGPEGLNFLLDNYSLFSANSLAYSENNCWERERLTYSGYLKEILC